MHSFTLGCMYWLDPKSPVEKIRSDLEEMKNNHFSLIRIFLFWEKVERLEGKYEFDNYDDLFAAAVETGIKVMATFGTYPPVWLKKKLAAEGINDSSRRYPCYDRPQVRVPMRKFIETVVLRYRNEEALSYWNLWNEPNKNACACPSTLPFFIEWLKQRYPSIRDLKQAWNGEGNLFLSMCPDSYEELTPEWLRDAFDYAPGTRITAMQFDWLKFACDNLNDNMRWIRDIVKKFDPVHRTHANPDTGCCNPLDRGVNEWLMARELDGIGISIHPSHHFFSFDKKENFPLLNSFCMDQIKSWAQEKEAWIGEFQAGTTSYHQNRFTPSPALLKQTLFHALAKGLHGVLFWEWQCWRAGMFEVGEFSLRNPSDGAPTDRSRAVEEFGAVFTAYSERISGMQPSTPAVAILHSVDTSIYKVLQGYNKSHLWDMLLEQKKALYGCWKSLDRANIAVRFVTEQELEENILQEYKVLYLPNVEVMSAGTAEKIADFVRNGGAVWADGRNAFLDEHVYLRGRIPGHALHEVFGCAEGDFTAAEAEFSSMKLENGKTLQAYRHIQELRPSSGRITAYIQNIPAAVSNHYGKGYAELWGTSLCLGIQQQESSENMDMIASFALAHGAEKKLTVFPECGIQADVMENETAQFIALTNLTGSACDVSVLLPQNIVRAECLENPRKCRCRLQEQRLNLYLEKDETAAVLCDKKKNSDV